MNKYRIEMNGFYALFLALYITDLIYKCFRNFRKLYLNFEKIISILNQMIQNEINIVK